MSRGSIHAVSMPLVPHGVDAALVRRARREHLRAATARAATVWQSMRRPGMIEPRVVEHVGDQVVDLLHVGVHGAQLRVQAFVDLAFEHGGRETHARQRRAHLVRQRGGHFLLALDELAHPRGHVVEIGREARELRGAVRGVERLAVVGRELLRGIGEHAQVAAAAAAATGRRSAGWTRRTAPAGSAPASSRGAGSKGPRRMAPFSAAECHR